MSDFTLITDAEQALIDDNPDEGFLTRFQDWASVKTDAPGYTLRAAGLMALSMAAGDTMALPAFFGKPIYLNLYIMVVGPSTIMRKTTVLGFVRDLLPRNQQNHQEYISYLDDVSIQAFNKAMAEAGAAQAPILLNFDEVAGIFQVSRSKTGSYLSGFDKVLMKAYDHSPVSIKRVRSSIDTETGAFVNIFAASTPEPLLEVLNAEDVESGLLPRFIIFDTRGAERGVRRSLMDRMDRHEEWKEKEEDLKEWLLKIAAPRANGVPTDTENRNPDGQARFKVTTLPISSEALQRLDEVDAVFTAQAGQDETGLGAIKGRAFWHIVKLSGLYALSRAGADATVELLDVVRALWLMQGTIQDLLTMTEEVGSNEHERLVKSVLKRLRNARGHRVRQSTLAREFKLDGRVYKDLTATLVLRQLITVEKEDDGTVYWRAT